MNPPVVVYIDDDVDEETSMQRAFDELGEIQFLLPQPNLDALIDEAFSRHPDAIVVDFRLTDRIAGIGYDGYDILQSVLERKDKFPIFILTSQQSDAFSEVDDVNFVYEKSQLHGDGTFAERVIQQISKYRKQLLDKESRILELIEKSRNGTALSNAEETELIELDSFIERSLSKKDSLPDNLKIISNERLLIDILGRVEALAQQVKDRLPNV